MPSSLFMRSVVPLRHFEWLEQHFSIQALMVSYVALDEVFPVMRANSLSPLSSVIVAGLSAVL